MENIGRMENGDSRHDFHFDSTDDLRKIWAAGMVSLEPGL